MQIKIQRSHSTGCIYLGTLCDYSTMHLLRNLQIHKIQTLELEVDESRAQIPCFSTTGISSGL